MAEKKPDFQYSKLIQVGVVVNDIEKAMERLSNYGIGPFSELELPPRTEQPTFHGEPFEPDTKVRFAKIGDVELEIFEPGKEPSPWKEYQDEIGEGIHHIAFAAEDAFEEADKFMSQGAELQCGGKWEGGGSVYMDLKVGNLILEFMKLD